MISIIVLNYNGKEFIGNCIKSVLEQTYNDFEIIIIDNNSNDGSYDYLINNFNDKRIKCYRSEKNLGFAGGNNFGLKYCSGELIVLLNNDTVVEKDWLKYLVQTIKSDNNIGLVQSLVYTEGIPMIYYEKNGTINLWGHNVMRFFNIDENGLGEILLASGTSVIINRELIEKTGGIFLDEYFLYSEDTFLSLKAKFCGYKLLHTSKSVVHHIGNATTKNQIRSDLYFYQERNRLLNFFIFFDKKFIFKYIPIFILNYKLKFFYCLFSKKYSLKGLFRSYFWFLGNFKWIKEQRRIIKNYKIVSDNDILKLISSKIFNGSNILERFINSILFLYCKLTCIKIIENAK